jgi:thiol-disulfide isomerase/thioredoxin
MDERTRRAVLGAGGVALAGLAGCTSLSGGSGGTDGRGGATTAARLQLDTYEVGGSTGETVPVREAGTVTLLDFFATWCAPCKPMMAELRQVRADFPDIHMLSITWEREEGAIRDFWREYEGTWNVASDPQLQTGEKYGVGGQLPTTLLLDADGNEAWRHVGLARADKIGERVEAAQG